MASDPPTKVRDDRITIKMESPTSDYYMVVEETTKVKVLIESINNRWGKEYFTLHHASELMESHKKLADYGVRDGSIIKVAYFAEFPYP